MPDAGFRAIGLVLSTPTESGMTIELPPVAVLAGNSMLAEYVIGVVDN